MLLHWYLDRIGAHNASTPFDALVNVSQKQFSAQEAQATKAGQTLWDGLDVSNIGNFVRHFGLASQSINIDPAAFRDQLQQYGPFVYIEAIGLDNLPVDRMVESLRTGHRYEHAVLISGLSESHSLWTIFFNDPAFGSGHQMDFFKFVTAAHRPFRGLTKSLILYLPHKILGH